MTYSTVEGGRYGCTLIPSLTTYTGLNLYSKSPKEIRYLSHRLVKKPIFWQFVKTDLIPSLMELSRVYRDKTTDKLIVLGNDENDKVITIPYYTRFSDYYNTTVRKKISNLYPFLKGYSKYHFLTLTVNPNDYQSLHDAYRDLQSIWNKLLTRLRKKYPNIFIVKTVELQKNGYPHLHVLIAGIGYLPRWFVMKTEAMHGKIYKSKYLRGYNHRRALNYILKYITKGSTDDNEWGYVQKVIQWALFSRTFSHSRLSLNTVMTNSNGNTDEPYWYIIGILKIDGIGLTNPIKTRDDYLYETNKGWT